MWIEIYPESIRIGSLNYISAALGLVAGINLAGCLNNWLYAKLKARNQGIGQGEFRVPVMVVGTLLLPIGLLWWGMIWRSKATLDHAERRVLYIQCWMLYLRWLSSSLSD